MLILRKKYNLKNTHTKKLNFMDLI